MFGANDSVLRSQKNIWLEVNHSGRRHFCTDARLGVIDDGSYVFAGDVDIDRNLRGNHQLFWA